MGNYSYQYTYVEDDKYRIHTLFRTRFCVKWDKERELCVSTSHLESSI